MSEAFPLQVIAQSYEGLKARKFQDRQKKLPVGIDGVSADVFDRHYQLSTLEIHRKLNRNENDFPAYNFGPLLRIERNKSNGGKRALHIPRLRDQIVLRILHDAIQDAAKKAGLNLITKSPHDYVKAFDEKIACLKNPWILKADITQFYDSVSRAKAIELCGTLPMQPEAQNLLIKWDRTLKIVLGYKKALPENFCFTGLPQGLSISSLLAELYANKIDKYFQNLNTYFRYVDDILIICNSEADAKDKLRELTDIIQSLGLHLSEQKTKIIRFSEGLDWLGMTHYPDKKTINPEKIEQWMKPIYSIQKEIIGQLVIADTDEQKVILLKKLVKRIDKYILGKKKSRIKWYSLVSDNGQWKRMDSLIHGLIRSCIRKSGVASDHEIALPSVHAHIQAIKKTKELQIQPTMGNAPTVE